MHDCSLIFNFYFYLDGRADGGPKKTLLPNLRQQPIEGHKASTNRTPQ